MGFIITGFAQYPVRYNSSRNYSRPNSALVIDTRGMRDFTVVVDNNMKYQSSGGAVTINSLRSGHHRILVYENRNGFFGLGRQRQMAIYNSAVQLKPGVETSVFVNRNGDANVTERSLYGYYNNNNNDNRWNDRRYNQPEIRN